MRCWSQSLLRLYLRPVSVRKWAISRPRRLLGLSFVMGCHVWQEHANTLNTPNSTHTIGVLIVPRQVPLSACGNRLRCTARSLHSACRRGDRRSKWPSAEPRKVKIVPRISTDLLGGCPPYVRTLCCTVWSQFEMPHRSVLCGVRNDT